MLEICANSSEGQEVGRKYCSQCMADLLCTKQGENDTLSEIWQMAEYSQYKAALVCGGGGQDWMSAGLLHDMKATCWILQIR